MRVAIVTVGDELLAGDTVNTNAAWLGRQLAERGVDVERVTTVPDREAEIVDVVESYRERYDAVLVTGGLGPTHDDLTMDAVAAAFDVPVEENEAALEWLAEDGYARADLAEGTADIPAGAEPLHNEEGVAPGCVIENVYVLPGVPAEMEAMFEPIADRFVGSETHVAFVTADEPESALVDRFASLREQFDVQVGSYPGEYVRVKLQADEERVVQAAAAWFRERVDVVENEAE
ncbi:competence/damage-inducible protein A [Halobacteriales archaeon QS_4_70_19]|jgi:molybdenum cofactor synthesis domain-containing protein|nr:MAG: competence/damage-inducible protein A [Halobacteriales archaeon QS_4_70_19]